MLRSLMLASALGLLSLSAQAFPTGDFRCVSGDITVTSTIGRMTVGPGDDLPIVTVTIKSGTTESHLHGIGLITRTTDTKTGLVDNRVRLAGTTYEMHFDDSDQVRAPDGSTFCHQMRN